MRSPSGSHNQNLRASVHATVTAGNNEAENGSARDSVERGATDWWD
jgi:hypothetical protein